MRPLPPLTLLVLLAFALDPAYADNGEIAYAHPVEDLTIDGDLSDWPEESESYVLVRHHDNSENPIEASFRVAYNPRRGLVYVGFEVLDDDHIADEGELGDLDSHVLYLDPTHSPRGSAPILFEAAGDRHEIIRIDGNWDPVAAAAKPSQARVVVVHRDGRTVYEWAVNLGDAVQPGRTLGFDHMIRDRDGDQPFPYSATVWGNFGFKGSRSARCGDLVLVDPTVPMGQLTGKLRWADGVEGPSLERFRVRIQSVDSQFWIQPDSDDESVYDVKLPVGKYRVSFPFPMLGDAFEWRIHDDAHALATVTEGEVSQADELVLDVQELDLPDHGNVLFGYEPSMKEGLDRFLEQSKHHYHVPGVSIALVDDGELVYFRQMGVRDYFTQDPVGKTTLFEAGSVTKIVFAFAANRLVERGILDLDRPLHEYLPFEEIAHDDRYRTITARHVLTHRTGFPNWGRYNASGQVDIKFDPGTDFGYSGEGFEYLGRVVAHLTGQSLEEVLKNEVQKPMGLGPLTNFRAIDGLSKVIAHGHDMTRPNVSSLPSSVGVAHSMHSNAYELAQFMVGLVERNGLSPAGYQAMLDPVSLAPERFAVQPYGWMVSFGLGFQVSNTEFGTMIGHGGSNHSNECRFEFYAEEKAGFVVLTNSDAGVQFYRAVRQYLLGTGSARTAVGER